MYLLIINVILVLMVLMDINIISIAMVPNIKPKLIYSRFIVKKKHTMKL